MIFRARRRRLYRCDLSERRLRVIDERIQPRRIAGLKSTDNSLSKRRGVAGACRLDRIDLREVRSNCSGGSRCGWLNHRSRWCDEFARRQ